MAKVKKMAFGGMGSRPPMGGMRPGMGVPNYAKPYMQQQNTTAPPGSIVPQQVTSGPPQSVMQKMAQAQPRGALGGNQAPAGANLMQAYQGQAGQNSMPDYAKPYMAQAGQPSAPPTVRSLAGMGAFMKKGGAVKAKAYAKGGTVSSASKRGDGCAQRGKTKGKMV